MPGTSSRAWLLGSIQWRHHQGDGEKRGAVDLGVLGSTDLGVSENSGFSSKIDGENKGKPY